MSREKLLVKLNEVESEMVHLSKYCKAWENEYRVITDQYYYKKGYNELWEIILVY